MRGRASSDLYFVDNAGDVVDERDGSGADTVHSSVDFSLADGAHARGAIENLYLTGTHNIGGAGNDLDNIIGGNSGANRIRGGGGSDYLDGRDGNDDIEGGGGGDVSPRRPWPRCDRRGRR